MAGCCAFAQHVIRGRWFSLFGSLIIFSSVGATGLFPLYSNEIKKSGFSQTQLNSFSVVKDLGSNLGCLAICLSLFLPQWCLVLMGSVMTSSGHIIIWFAVTGRTKPEVWLLYLSFLLLSNAAHFAKTGSFQISKTNFPDTYSLATQVLNLYSTLSPAILTQAYLPIYGSDSTSVLLFLSWFPSLIFLSCMFTIRKIDTRVILKNERNIWQQLDNFSFALALFLTGITITQRLLNFSQTNYKTSTFVMLMIMCCTLGAVLFEDFKNWKMEENSQEIIIDEYEENQKEEELPKNSVVDDVFKRPPNRGEEFGKLQGVWNFDFILIMIFTGLGVGSCITGIDNLGQVGESYLYDIQSLTTFVSLVSVWGYCGRVFSTLFSESRPIILSMVMFLTSVGYLMIAYGFRGSVYAASIVFGFSFGAQSALTFDIIRDLFGKKNSTTLFNISRMTIPISSYFLKRTVGAFYDAECLEMQETRMEFYKSGNVLTCQGKSCFAYSFKILGVTTIVGSVTACVLVMTTWEFYRVDFHKNHKDGNQKGAETASATNSNN